MNKYITHNQSIQIFHGDCLEFYGLWESPTVIISDGPYGLAGFPGDPPTPDFLPSWYEKHIQAWSNYATPQTTLWFWNTEHSWAKVHPILEENGWDYISCHIWDKGVEHIAGNANSKTLRRLPVVTELCVQYVKRADFKINGNTVSMKEWLRHEWQRSGLPLSKTNEACGVKNAATRKYFTKCHLWYFPPAEAFEKFSYYANENGQSKGKPYFSIDGLKPLSKSEWEKMRSKFYCPHGVTNVWREPPLNGKERIKLGSKAVHLNQKPLKLMRLLIEVSSDKGDVVWEPFGGLCSGTVASYQLGRRCSASEIDHKIYLQAVHRLRQLDRQPKLAL